MSVCNCYIYCYLLRLKFHMNKQTNQLYLRSFHNTVEFSWNFRRAETNRSRNWIGTVRAVKDNKNIGDNGSMGQWLVIMMSFVVHLNKCSFIIIVNSEATWNFVKFTVLLLRRISMYWLFLCIFSLRFNAFRVIEF